MEDLLGIKEVSEKLKVKESTLRSWVHYRKIPIVRVGRRLIRFRQSAIEQWIEDNNKEQKGNAGKRT
jgi:excisionase family DNA binding protein